MGKRIQNRHLLILFIILMVFIGAGIVFLMMQEGFFLDKWEKRSIQADINKDGKDEVLQLDNRKMCIMSDGNNLWETPKEWKVVDFLFSDIDRDGEKEVLFLVWKRGSFGEFTPFWEENGEEFTQHIFIYRWEEERLAPIWMSSKLRPRVDSWEIVDEDKIHIITDAGEDTIWIWSNWGLSRIK